MWIIRLICCSRRRYGWNCLKLRMEIIFITYQLTWCMPQLFPNHFWIVILSHWNWKDRETEKRAFKMNQTRSCGKMRDFCFLRQDPLIIRLAQDNRNEFELTSRRRSAFMTVRPWYGHGSRWTHVCFWYSLRSGLSKSLTLGVAGIGICIVAISVSADKHATRQLPDRELAMLSWSGGLFSTVRVSYFVALYPMPFLVLCARNMYPCSPIRLISYVTIMDGYQTNA